MYTFSTDILAILAARLDDVEILAANSSFSPIVNFSKNI